MGERSRNGVITVEVIARETGCSASTVSAVLAGRHVKRRISEQTVARVLKAARRLGYVPNLLARNLRAKSAGTTQIVLAILTSYEAPAALLTQGLKGLESAIAREKERGVYYTVNVEIFRAGMLATLPGLTDGHRCNGAIITNTIDLDDQFLTSTKLNFPVVLSGRKIAGYPSVSTNSEMIGRQAAEILMAAGRRRLAVIQPTLLTQATRSRLAAFVTTVEHAMGVPPQIVTCEGMDERDGFAALNRFLKPKPNCDGIFAVIDSLAIGAYAAIKRFGQRIPDNIAMVGIGDHTASHYLDPPLTCFEYSQEEQQVVAAEMLLDLVNGRNPKAAVVELAATPLLRESTGHSSNGE